MPAATEPDPYVVLELPRTATAAQIRAAYLAAGARYHPDRHQGNPLAELASAKMAEVNRAYEVLSDPVRRAAFDRGGPAGVTAPPSGQTVGDRSGLRAGTAARKRFVGLVAFLSLLPVLLRFGGLIVRGFAVVFREIAEGLALVRGTPFVLGAVVVASSILVLVLLRSRRR